MLCNCNELIRDLANELAELRARLTWTKETPKVEGFYWRYPGIPVRVFKRSNGPQKGELWFDGFGLVGLANNPDNPGIEWAGPIPRPEVTP